MTFSTAGKKGISTSVRYNYFYMNKSKKINLLYYNLNMLYFILFYLLSIYKHKGVVQW